jgi:hypothetical protein
LTQITPESKQFLTELFAELLKDTEESQPDATEKAAIYAALLDALKSGSFPDDEKLRQYVAGLAKATDEENGYELAVLEHDALAELRNALDRSA